MLNTHPTQFEDINSIIIALSQKIIEVLGENLIGIYLFGSLSYGDFDVKSSDIDLITILKEPASFDEIKKLRLIHMEIEHSFPDWAKRIESSYTPLEMLSQVNPPGARPYCGEAIFYDAADYGNEWIINLYLLQKHGIALFGPEFSTLIKPVNISDVQAACIKDLHKEWEPKLNEPEWFDNPHYESYLILNLCRILNTVKNASALSKKKSAEWVKSTYPQWKELIEIAQAWSYGKEMNKKSETIEFLRFVIDQLK